MSMGTVMDIHDINPLHDSVCVIRRFPSVGLPSYTLFINHTVPFSNLFPFLLK